MRAHRVPPQPKKPRSFLWRWRRGLFLVGLLLVASLAGTGFVLAQIPLPPEEIVAQTTFICTFEVQADCNQDNATARLFGEQDRVNVRLGEIPQVVVDAVLAAEDRDFFQHSGVDPVGIARAAWQDIRHSGGATQGGSTITQQYVKLTRLTTERTITRKIKEAVLAIKLEQELSKEQILERYLNLIYFGRGAYGVGTAARTYFGHDITEVDLAEAAFLAGLIRGPEAADPVRDPEEATRRRLTVLDAMLEVGSIDQAAHTAAAAEPWVVGPIIDPAATVLPRTERQGLGEVVGREYGTEYFIEYVRRELLRVGYTDSEIYGGGLRVYTTLDHRAQQAAYAAIEETLDREDDPLASLVAVDGTGQIRAMVGGNDFQNSEVNLAVGTDGGGTGQQAGSSMKPFVLAAAVSRGISLQSKFESQGTMTFEIPGDDWRVSNYGGTEQGVLSLVDATRVSSNTVYAQLMLEVGPQNVVDLADRLGIESPLDPFPALVLGTEEVSPLEMASAYSTFGRNGEHVQETAITRVERPDGSVEIFDQERSQVLTPEQDAQVVFALRQVIDRGTGTAARLSVPAAGKTGTTQDNADAWFVGFLPNAMTAAVWMGYDPVDLDGDGTLDARFMNDVHGRSVTGGSFPAEIWHRFMADWLEIVGTDVGRFPSVESFPGDVLNPDLTTTTEERPECAERSSDETGTTEPCERRSTTTTTRPPCGIAVEGTTDTTEACETSTTPSTEAPTTVTEAPTTTLFPPDPSSTAPPTTVPPPTTVGPGGPGGPPGTGPPSTLLPPD
ncbi:MAG: transglycosylase domain-containing protein [Acidimicrobiia bacterium]|nr:transglycosylase domain-containing protein [Acidimicrobiia bacterium]